MPSEEINQPEPANQQVSIRVSLTKALIEEPDIRAMERAVRVGAVSQGSITSELERAFASEIGAVGAVATNSGTSALLLALRTLGVRGGDDVVLPTFTCTAILNAVSQMGAVPVLSDVTCDPERMDYNASAEEIGKVLTSRTKAIILPHMFGVPAAAESVRELGIPVIEDITLSLGAMDRGRPVGSRGALSVCSLHVSKMITSGEGGILTASSSELCERARYLNGWEADQAPLRFSSEDLPGYEVRYNFHLSDIAASLGLAQLSRLRQFLDRRRELARRYTECIRSLGTVVAPVVEGSPNVFFRYLVLTRDSDVIAILRAYADAGIECGRGVYPALHRYINRRPEFFPNAERAMRGLISIPLYPALTDEEVDYILDHTVRILGQ